MRRSRQLSLELLEDRCTPANWGIPWPDASHLTLSFAADGTQVGARSSDLQARLDAQLPNINWQREVLRALQTWAVHANVNVGVVSDGGQPFGVAGVMQGDSRFGDIRVGGYSMSKDVVAVSGPFEVSAGTWGGDVKFNTAYTYGPASPAPYDFFTVALHELGHTLGLGESDNPDSVMYSTYQRTWTGLSKADVAAIQALYGARAPDQYETKTSNGSFTSATRLNLLDLKDGLVATEAEGDLTTVNDVDYYVVKPLVSAGLTFRLQTLGVSLAQARMTVYDGSKKVIATVASPECNAGNLEVRINKLSLLGTYYVKVEGVTDDVFGIGGYRLKVDSLPGVTGLVETTGGVLADLTSLLNNDLHTDDTFLTASLVPALFTQTDSRFDFAYKASISDSWDVDYYKIKAPQPEGGQANVMKVMSWGLKENGLEPRVSVFDSQFRAVAAQVLVNEAGNYVIQVPNATGGANYYVKVQAAQPGTAQGKGNYFLGVDFGAEAEVHDSFAPGTLTAAKPQTFFKLDVFQTSLFHLLLAVDNQGSNVAAGIRLTIYDATDNVVHTRVGTAGDTVSTNVFLPVGSYLIRMAGGTLDANEGFPDMPFNLTGSRLDGPVGPQPNDASGAPSGGGSGTSSPPGWTGTTSTKPTSDPYGNPYT